MTARRLKKNKRWSVIKFGFLLYFFVSIFTLVWLRTAVLNLEYGVSQLQKQKNSAIKDKKLLSAERAGFYSMKNIEETAMKDLGMSLPEREKVFFVKRIPAAGPYGVSIRSVQPMAPGEDRKNLIR